VLEFNTRWVRISLPQEAEKVFLIEEAGQSVQIGQFLRPEQFKRLVSELKSCLG
jgi:uncharacterized membrane protein